MDTSQAMDLAKAAVEYGPYLFAILYIAVVPPFAYSKYRSATQTFTGPTSQNVSIIAESRMYFRYSWVAGLVLVTCAVGWWIYAHHDVMTRATDYFVAYEGTIYDVRDNQINGSPDERIYLMRITLNNEPVYRFLVLMKQPISEPKDYTLRWINPVVATNNVGGFGGTSLQFSIRPMEKHYKFVIDGEAARIVPEHPGAFESQTIERRGGKQ